MLDILLKLLKRIDPKWLPAIIAGITLVATLIYLIYAKNKAESLNKKLKKKLALAESSALSDQADTLSAKASAKITEAEKASKEADAIKAQIDSLKLISASKKDKLLKATAWEDLGL